MYLISKRELTPEPVLVMRRRITRSEIAATITEVLPRIFQYAMEHSLPLIGMPFARYQEADPEMVTIEPGMRLAPGARPAADGDSEVLHETLPGGSAAVTTHAGPYDQLPAAYSALEAWIKNEHLRPAGAPWECYLNDPGSVPDPKDWLTEIIWPVAGM